jgi:hypothetical protein
MEQSSSWETNRFSTSQEIARILRNPNVNYRIHKCLPPLPEVSVQVRGFLFEHFVTRYVLRWGVVSTSPNPQAGGPPLVGCARLHIIQYIQYWMPFLHPRLAVVTGTHFSRDVCVCVCVCVCVYIYIYIYICIHGTTAPSGPGPSHFRDFTITLRHIALVRTPLDEWSAQGRDLYLTTDNTRKSQASFPPASFEPAIPASERQQT